MKQKFRRIVEDFWVAPQLVAEDFAAISELGIRTVINNRPDGEAPGQLSDAEARVAAAAAGLVYAYLPVISGGIVADDVAAMAELIARTPGPRLAWCRSGTRSCHLWAMAAARSLPPAEIIAAARAAGYDLTTIAPLLEAIWTAHRQAASVSEGKRA